jgi:stage V sporulation protein B
MLFFSQELGAAIYKNTEAALYIRVLAPLIPVMYIDSAVDAILKGSGHQVYSMNVNIIDTLAACVFAITLVPTIGIWGYVISIYATEILNTTLSIMKMISVSNIRTRPFRQVFMPILCIIGSTNVSKLILTFLIPLDNGVLRLAVGILISILIYVAFLFLTRTVSSQEFEFLNASLLSEKRYNEKYRQMLLQNPK